MHAIHVNAKTASLPDLGIRAGADRGEPVIAAVRLHEQPEVGVWTSAPGGWPVDDRPDTEVAVILAGRARITNDDGSSVEVAQGDVVVLPRGWTGRWDVIEPVRKAYVLA